MDSFQASGVNEIIVDEYLKDAKTPEDIRDASLDLLGDLFLVIPAIKVANYHRGKPVETMLGSARLLLSAQFLLRL